MMKNYLVLLLSILGLWAMAEDNEIKHDTMYLWKSGVLVAKYHLANQVDSMTFENMNNNQSDTLVNNDTIRNMDSLIGTFTDSRDGNTYKYVTIGNQVWMAENLKYLPRVNPPSEGAKTFPYYYVYGYKGTDVDSAKSTVNFIDYGVLYNFAAALNSEYSSTKNPSGIQGVCPSNWHLPSDSEWTQLIDYIKEIKQSDANGSSLKAKKGWFNESENTDEYGFKALPSGARIPTGSFSNLGGSGLWWTSTVDSNGNSLSKMAVSTKEVLATGYSSLLSAFSIRCVRD